MHRCSSVVTLSAVIQRLIAHILGRAGMEFARHMGKVLGQLVHEVTGFVFLALGAIAVPAVYKEWKGESKTRSEERRVGKECRL